MISNRMFPKEIDTARLSLQPINPDDSVAVYRNWASDPQVTRYLNWRPHRSVSDTYRYISSCREGWKKRAEFTWLVIEKESGEPVGAFAARPGTHGVQIGFVLMRARWNLGFMTEVVRDFLDYCMSCPEHHRVWAVCDIENTASERVLVKSGMVCEGILRSWAVHPAISDQPRDCLCYSYTRADARPSCPGE